MGKAATALGCVINALPSRPGSQALLPAPLLEQALLAMGAAAENAPRLSQSANARTGVALGLAALLGAPHMLPDGAGGDTWLLTRPECAGHAKQALEVCSLFTLSWVCLYHRKITLFYPVENA